jgi:type I restriction enzyme S subunit
MSELYTLPDGWEWKKLAEIVKLQNGFTFKSNLFVSDGLPIVRIKNIKNEKILLDDVVYFNMEDYGKKLDSYQIKKNDILIAMSGATTGKIGLYETNTISYLNQRVGLFRIEDSNLRSYLFYFLSTQIEKNLELSLGAAQPNLSTEQINNIMLPFPPIEEQKRIVTKLNNLFTQIDKSIALHQKNIDEANVFMASVLNDIFVELEEKYGLKEINSLFKIKSGNFLPAKNMIEDGEINVYGGNGINGKHNEFNLSGENIIIGRVGALCGNVRCVNDNIWLTDNAFYISEYFEDIDKKFLTQMLIHIDLGSSANKSAQPVISYKGISEMTLPLPPLKTQQKVVLYLDEISNKMENIKQIQKEKMQSLKALKASILDQAFKGEL